MDFETTPTEVIEEDPIDFTVDGTTYTAVRPTPAQTVLLLLDWQHGEQAKAAAVVDTFLTIVTPSLAGRLADRHDPFDLNDITRIMRWLTVEWNQMDADREARTHLRIVPKVVGGER